MNFRTDMQLLQTAAFSLLGAGCISVFLAFAENKKKKDMFNLFLTNIPFCI